MADTPLKASAAAAQPAVQPSARPAPAKNRELRQVAQEFEALFLAQMMANMFSGIDPNGPFGGGPGEVAFRDMLNQEYAKVMARSGGVGVADAVMREILRQQEGK
ncbi:MAG TPA: rod-binding protein [Alphaproteobacteria bacterium]|jgi:Rod binding domain-containing protein